MWNQGIYMEGLSVSIVFKEGVYNIMEDLPTGRGAKYTPCPFKMEVHIGPLSFVHG